jgi:hypothetical protein
MKSKIILDQKNHPFLTRLLTLNTLNIYHHIKFLCTFSHPNHTSHTMTHVMNIGANLSHLVTCWLTK